MIPFPVSGEALAAAGDFPLEVVPGVELSCLYKEKEIHILGLYIDHTDKAFLDFLDQAEIKRNSRNQLRLAAFQKDGFPITMGGPGHGKSGHSGHPGALCQGPG